MPISLDEFVRSLSECGLMPADEVRAFITEGNVASERLCMGAGFARLAPP